MERRRVVNWPVLSWTRTVPGLIAMALINLISLGAFGYLAYEARQARISEAAAEAETSASIAEWMATDLYAPTSVEVVIGPTMETTRIVETPLFDGPRVRAAFDGQFIVKLIDLDAGALVCTMPAKGWKSNPYDLEGPRSLDMTWAAYTGDDGRCFAEMKPGVTYATRTFRQATKIIDGHTVRRPLDPIRSTPFVFGGE
jgi:hypothetical protein